MTTIKVEVRNGNLRVFAEFFSMVKGVTIEYKSDCLIVAVDAEPGNAAHIKYVAGKYGCDAKQV